MKIGIIGGGIVGATAGFFLAQNQQDVTLFDNKVGQATSAAAGIISPWLSQRRNQNWYHLAKAGAKFYPELIKQLNLPPESDVYKQVGTIIFKKNEALLTKLHLLGIERKKEAPEIGELSLLSSAELKKRMPLLTPEMPGLFVSGGARVDGRLLINSLLANFTELGGSYQQTMITKIERHHNKWQVKSNHGTDSFDKLILATGAWLPNLIEPLGFSVDVRAQKGQLVKLKLTQDCSDWPVVMPQGESDIIPLSHGEILVGATHENEQDYNLEPDPLMIKALLDSLENLAPSLSQAQQIETRVGTRAYTSDFLPFFGEIAELPQLFVASGLGSSGLTTGPIIGHALAAWVCGTNSSLLKENYSPATYIRPLKRS